MGITMGALGTAGGAIAGWGSSAMAGLSSMGGSAMGWLGGSTASGMSNAGLLSMGTNLLGSLSGSSTQRNEAKVMERMQELEWQQRMADTRGNYKQIAETERAVNQEYREDLMQNQISLAQQQAQVELLAGASGTGGGSVTAMMTDLSATAGRNQSTLVQNFEYQQQSISNQLRAIQSGGSVEKRSFSKPSAFNTLTSAVGAGVGGYMSGASMGKELSTAWKDSRRTSNIKLN